MKKTIITVVALLVILSVVVYGYEFIFKKPVIESPTTQESSTSTTQVEIKEQHKDAQYTFAGEIELPTPCHIIKTQVNKLSETEYQIQIDTIAPAQDVMCAQVITPKPYKVSFESANEVTITALIDGVLYETNRFLISNDENIDTFKLEIKG